jgi:hypothetical protein
MLELVDDLARAAGSGDVGAQTRLGLRLISGAEAPCLPDQGARLLADAARRGGAEAAGRLSVLAALGVGCRADLKLALDLLRRSAGLGWAPALQQLALLGGQDLEAWTTPPPPEILVEDPPVRRFPGIASPEVCAWLVDQARPRLVRAEVYDYGSGHGRSSDYRSNSAANFSLVDTHLLVVLLQARIAAALGAPLANLEAANVLHYATGEKFDEHFDYIDPSAPGHARVVASGGQRRATCIVYLNDDYAGGETEFTRLGLSHKGALGVAMAFPGARPDGTLEPRTAHAGRPPTSGEKWILVQFVRDKAQL